MSGPSAGLNLYPAKVRYNDELVRNVRVRADHRGTVIWRMDKATGEVSELVRTPCQPERVGATQTWRLEDLVIEPQRGCGCNHPMYTWVPPDDE